MPSEEYIEQESCRRIQRLLGDAQATPKFGENGDPDRQILLGRGLHCWFEYKQQNGKLRAAQIERRRQLEARGELVYVPKSVEQAVLFFFDACQRLGVAPQARKGS